MSRTIDTAELTTERIHEAAREAVLDLGVRYTTLVEVARRAGVSRMSIYRRYADVGALLREVLTTEFVAIVERAVERADAEAPHGRARVVGRTNEIATEIRASKIWQKIARDEPVLLTPYIFERLGATQLALLEAIENSIRIGQADGSIRDGDPHVFALTVLLASQSFTHSAGTAPDVGEDQLLLQVPILLDRYLRPGG